MAEMGHQLVWRGWQSIQIVGGSACAIFILHQKIQKMVKCTFWYQLTRVVPDRVQRAVKWLCVCVCVCVCVHLAESIRALVWCMSVCLSVPSFLQL